MKTWFIFPFSFAVPRRCHNVVLLPDLRLVFISPFSVCRDGKPAQWARGWVAYRVRHEGCLIGSSNLVWHDVVAVR